jgi:hypothetical protein
MKKLAFTFALFACLLAARFANASLALVQVTPIVQGNSIQTASVTFSSHVTAGHFIGVAFGQTISAGGPPYAPSATCTDGTDTYTQLRNDGAQSAFGTQQYQQFWYSGNITASSAITVSLNSGSGFIINWAVAFEVSGQNTTTPIDNSGGTQNNAAAPLQPVTFTTTAANTMVVGIAQTSGAFATSWIPAAGYTVLATSTGGNAPAGVFYQLETSAGSVSPLFSLNPNDYAILSAFAIKGAGGAATQPAIFFTSSN